MKKNIVLTLLLISISCFCFVTPVFADQSTTADKAAITNAITKIGKVEKAVNLSHTTNLNTSAGIVISGLMGIIGVVALLFFIYGGIMWMTSEGADETLKKAQKTMIWAAIGLIAVFLSYSVMVKVFTFSDVLYDGQTFSEEEAGTIWGDTETGNISDFNASSATYDNTNQGLGDWGLQD